ncbi:MAG: glutamine--fructose-6-phosphate transaminase (isomerizing) [Thermoplasmatales archaeon]|nr:glutamine--fructose-6-phosphate transaminase (isomerizing) [Thermoplasmatales archaeon]
MCGIFGIVFKNKKKNLGRILVDAGKRLVYRGYDSVGAATIDNNRIDLRKDVGTIKKVVREYKLRQMTGNRGIIQLRWATFGRPSKLNAQPYSDCSGRFVGAHNGNIVNNSQLRRMLISEGHNLEGWNDGETIVHVIEKCFNKTKDIKKAIMSSAKMLHGDYAYVLMDKQENKTYTVKMGSSLYLGVGRDFICCSSDLPSILPLTRNIVPLKDGEFVEFTPEDYKIFNIETGAEIKRNAEKSELNIESASKGGFKHYMLKEIYEQPETVRTLLKVMDESEFIDKFLEYIEEADQVYLVGSGSSYNACVCGAYYFNKIAHIPVTPVIAGSFVDSFGNAITEKSVIICVSQSGETKDVINVVNYCRKTEKGKILGVLNVLGSTLMLSSEAYLPLACDLEVSVPATKTFLNQVVLLLYLALQIGGRKNTLSKRKINEIKREVEKLPELLSKTIKITKKECEKLSKKLVDVADIYCLGYGLCHGITLEGALKIKEITYAHCEGMYSSEFKHGPLAIINEKYPVIYVTIPEDAHMIISHMNEVACRGGNVITIAEECKSLRENSTNYIPVPTTSALIAPILNIIPLQLLAYYWSINKGINPDFPRNLSKTLTVD